MITFVNRRAYNVVMRVVNDTYAVFFDTNTVKGKYWIDHSVRQKAVTIKDDNIIKIELYLPEVVQKEWSRYYVRHAKEQYDKILDASNKLLDMNFDTQTFNVFDETKVNVNSKKYLKSLGFTLVTTPHDEIDYKELVELAIKHAPPFEPSDGSDKGLKDAIIAHTIKDFATKNPTKKIVFIGRDGLMTTYLKKLMPVEDSFVLCDSIEDFAEIMKLTNSKLNKELAKGASEAFFIQDVKSTFYYVLRTRDLLIARYRAKIIDAEAARKHLKAIKINPESSLSHTLDGGQWSTGSNQILIPDSSFQIKENERLYWTVELDFVQNYNVDKETSTITGMPTSHSIKHIVVYKVLWSAELTETGDLVNPKIETVSDVDEYQTIKTQNSLGGIDNLTAFKQLLNPSTLAGLSSAVTSANSVAGGLSSALRQLNPSMLIKDLPSVTLPNLSTFASDPSLLSQLTVPSTTRLTLDTKPPTLDPKLPNLDISPTIDHKTQK
jgi:hypothetical protein